MNRVFPGNAQGTPAEQIAYLLTSQVFSQADFLMDLHGGDLHESIIPFVAYARSSFEEITAFSKESARLMGFSYLLEANFPATTFGTAANMNVPGFIAELGQMGRWSETDISAYLSSIKNVLKSLHLIQGEVVKLAESPITLSNFTTVLSETAGCWYPCGALGDCVNQGDKIGEVRDVFSTLLKEYYAACDGIVLVLIRSLAVNVNDPLFAIGSLGDEACTNM
jgi:predicted deacylase